jgi:hypothetical protein
LLARRPGSGWLQGVADLAQAPDEQAPANPRRSRPLPHFGPVCEPSPVKGVPRPDHEDERCVGDAANDAARGVDRMAKGHITAPPVVCPWWKKFRHTGGYRVLRQLNEFDGHGWHPM